MNTVRTSVPVLDMSSARTADGRFDPDFIEALRDATHNVGFFQITGYGERASQNQHSRMYAHQLNPALPNPPAGSLAGGPNSSIQDPVAARILQGCAPQFCYIDDIESWSTNEITINWNAPLSWVAAFVADQDAGDVRGRLP